MPHAGQVTEGQGGFRLRLVQTGADGSVRTVIDGVEAIHGAGETFTVPAGTPHQMSAEGPARVRWEVRPALRTAEFFERLHRHGPDSARVADSPGDFLAEFAAEIRLT
jgi:hypothetical protein